MLACSSVDGGGAQFKVFFSGRANRSMDNEQSDVTNKSGRSWREFRQQNSHREMMSDCYLFALLILLT